MPRQLDGGPRQEFAYAIDMWSLGCLLHEMLTSQTPFMAVVLTELTDTTILEPSSDIDQAALFAYCRNITPLPIEKLEASGVSKLGINLIQQLLSVNPVERPTAVHALRHPWLVEVDSDGEKDSETYPGPAVGTINTDTHNVTEEECFNNFTTFIDSEKQGLRIFYDNEALEKLAPRGKSMVEELLVRGCNRQIAMQLSILVLYDMVLLIGMFVPSCFRKPDVRRLWDMAPMPEPATG